MEPQQRCYQNCTNRRLDFSSSVVRTAEFAEDSEIATQECWTRGLEPQFVQNRIEDEQSQRSLKWQYIGTPSGFYRIYPGVTQEECFSYDPRIRPWYVTATSGPKNVILVIDVSGSMNNNGRLELALDAAITVIKTLTNSDFVTVIVFSDSAQQLLVFNQLPNTLIPATNKNIYQLCNLLYDLSAYGGTNFQAAMELAFQVLDETGENSANCHSAILFLTDGHPTQGSIQSESGLTNLVQQLNSNGDTFKATVFTYTLGSGASTSIPLAIACGNRGIYAHVDDGGNLRGQMSQYYDYYASLRRAGDEHVMWVEPYMDASGAGMLVTASKAVYDMQSHPVRLLGVVAVDILVSDLETAGLQSGIDFEGVVSRLALRNICPSIDTANVSECELNFIRSSNGGMTCSSEICNEPSSTACPASANSINYCSFQLQRYMSATAYREEACCGGFSACLDTNGATVTVAIPLYVSIVSILVVASNYYI